MLRTLLLYFCFALSEIARQQTPTTAAMELPRSALQSALAA
jgi:hypothetical protein